MEENMSLSVAASGSAIASQLLASLLSQTDKTSSTDSNSTITNATPSTASNVYSNGSLTGSSKPSLSDDILSTFMQLQQNQEKNTTTAAGNFLEPAFPNAGTSPQQPAPSQTVSTSPAHNNMMRAIQIDSLSNDDTPSPSVAASADTSTDETDDAADTSAASSVGFQTASKAAFGL
jgi:hypothetical protein